jgi:hypothetical protein
MSVDTYKIFSLAASKFKDQLYFQKDITQDQNINGVHYLLTKLGLSWISARSKHPKQDKEAQALYKKLQKCSIMPAILATGSISPSALSLAGHTAPKIYPYSNCC